MLSSCSIFSLCGRLSWTPTFILGSVATEPVNHLLYEYLKVTLLHFATSSLQLEQMFPVNRQLITPKWFSISENGLDPDLRSGFIDLTLGLISRDSSFCCHHVAEELTY